MTEMTYIPDPDEAISHLRAIDLDKFANGDLDERARLLDVVKWLLVLVHCFDIQMVPKKYRNAAIAAEQEVGRLSARIMLRLENGHATSVDLEAIKDLYMDLCDDVSCVCQEIDTGIALKFIAAVKCPT